MGLKWQLIDERYYPEEGRYHRAAVPGGWLVRLSGPDNAIALTFVPDGKHWWDVDE